MKNYEKYANKIREYEGSEFCDDFVMPYILKSDRCSDISCDGCRMTQMIWLLEEYEEPEVDWSKVEVDTPIMVRDDGDKWVRRYFAKYEDGIVYAWEGGRTSWTSTSWTKCDVTKWDHAKLAESEEV